MLVLFYSLVLFVVLYDSVACDYFTLSLHDALPILLGLSRPSISAYGSGGFTSYSQEQLREQLLNWLERGLDRKSTRLNSSHLVISYAVFCLKKKKKQYKDSRIVNESE